MLNAKEVLGYFKNTDSGRYGKAFEIMVKSYLNGNKGNSKKVSLRGKTDVTFHRNKIEIKSNCGEISEDIDRNAYIIYSMDNKTDYATPENARVLTAGDFLTMLANLGLIRDKKTSSGTRVKAIQTYANSKKKTLALTEALNEYPTLEEWKACH